MAGPRPAAGVRAEGAQVVEHLQEPFLGDRDVGRRQQHRELLAADAADDVVSAQPLAQ